MKLPITIFLIFISISLFGQREELLNNISDAACECMSGKDLSTNFEMVMGLCILQAASPLSDQIKEELEIDLADMNNYEKLGELVGVTLVTRCPDFMDAMMEYMDLEEEFDPEESVEEENETWSDMDAAAAASGPEYGGPENKMFITEPIADTNGSGLSKPFVSGSIKSVKEGLVNEITVKTSDGTKILYLDQAVIGNEKLSKGANLTIYYLPQVRFNAAKGVKESVWIITALE